MEPYVIKQGDYLLKVAHDLGFDAMTIWNDPSNAQLRALRPSPDILFAGDILYVPDQVDKAPDTRVLASGSTNVFVANAAPTVNVSVKLVGAEATTFSSLPYTVLELPDLTSLVTDANGVATFAVPVTLDTATVVFTGSEVTAVLSIAAMNPVATPSGIFMRLQNLGFVETGASFDFNALANNLDVLRTALRAFQASQAGANGDESGSSGTGAGSSVGSNGAAGSPPPAAGPSTGSPSAAASDPAVSPASKSSGALPPDSSGQLPESGNPPASVGDGAAPVSQDSQDNAGLSDDGVLDDAIAKQLVAAYGS